jgi:hypothetical protein
MRLWAIAAGVGLAAIASSQEVHGELEYFYLGAPIEGHFRVIERTQRFSFSIEEQQFRAVFGYWWVGQFDVSELDETYLEYSGKDWSLLAGRHFTHFGLTDWYEQWYSGFVKSPFIHVIPMSSEMLRFRARYDTSVIASSHIGDVDVEAGLTDPAGRAWQIGPDHLDHGFARAQTMVGPFIVGASALVGGDDTAIYGADIRWSIPNWQVRAEVMFDQLDGDDGSGFYVDLFHRPPGWTNATLLARWQAIDHPHAGGAFESMTTLGARFRLNDYTNFDANYSFGPESPFVQSQIGWCFQLRFSYRF